MDLSGHQGEIPIPMVSSPYAPSHGAHGIIIHNHSAVNQTLAPPSHHHHHHHQNHPSQNGPSPPPLALVSTTSTEDSTPTTVTTASPTGKKRVTSAARYKECLKNHAASIGGNATDGCGEFLPGGEDGTLEALKCAVCGCHRNFHRKETEGDSCDCTGLLKGRQFIGQLSHQRGLIVSGQEPLAYLPRHAPPAPHHMIMPLSAMQTSESDDMEEGIGMSGRPALMRQPTVKKRFRTKFTPEQKEKMLGFAEKVGWRLQKLDDGMVQQFCQEIGVKRRVLKVWMHNNKHSLAKKIGGSSPSPMHLEHDMATCS